MKHTALITFFLIVIFILTQVVGLSLIKSISSNLAVDENGNTVIAPDPATVDMTPKTTGALSLIYIIASIAIGTAIILLIVKFNKVNIWKAWFFLAVAVAIGISCKVIFKDVLPVAGFIALLPWIIGAVFALLKILWRNPVFYNITEILMYAGIALILAPIFNVLWAIILLIIISGYDMYAVWKSKHMVSMAQFQQKSSVFAGIMIPYKIKGKKDAAQPSPIPAGKASAKVSAIASKTAAKTTPKTASNDDENKTAILGGGDVAFPLIFEGVVLRDLIIKGLTPNSAFLHAGIIIATTTIALAILFIMAKKDRFYPAMPFISAGCLVGWGITLLI